jgi:hypothetical protein
MRPQRRILAQVAEKKGKPTGNVGGLNSHALQLLNCHATTAAAAM